MVQLGWISMAWKHHRSLFWIGNVYDSCTDGRPCCLHVFVNEIDILYRHGRSMYCDLQGLEMFDGNMYVATTSALTWYIVVELFFSLHLPSLFGSSPKSYSAFPDISGKLFLKIHSDGFAAPLQLVFLPFLTKFLMKGLVRWVLSSLLLHGVLSLWTHADS